MPITLTVMTDGGYSDDDLVTVVVVSNTLVIGIDGTGSAQWLAKKDANENLVNERNTPDGTRWNSHVRNLVADSDSFAMTIYQPGPPSDSGAESGNIFRAVRDLGEQNIQDAGGGTSITIVGWSRGAMIAAGVANALANPAPEALPREVVFVGMYDPVDMSIAVEDAWARIDAKVQAVTIVGPNSDDCPKFNVDYPLFARMALQEDFQWLVTHAGDVNIVRKFYNASHGAIGGTPGYHKSNLDPPRGRYDYDEDVRNSIQADIDVRSGMRAAGLNFLPVRDEAWYGFPDDRPPQSLWE